jgi:autotransporter-associated beta strand protein
LLKVTDYTVCYQKKLVKTIINQTSKGEYFNVKKQRINKKTAALLAALALNLPGVAFATETTIPDNTNGPYAKIYGNSGDATDPVNDASTTSSDNKLTLGNGTTGPTITGSPVANVIGGQDPDVNNAGASGNELTINGGTEFTTAAYIYGGQVASGSGDATGNTVTINGFTSSGGDISVYGGQSYSGNATGNTVIIATTGETYNNIYGGQRNNSGDIFTGNTLKLAAGNTIASAQNFQFITFTSAGDAGITDLITTVTGADSSLLVQMNTNGHDITFAGIITGAGGIDKTGEGLLTLSGANDYSGNTAVTAGTLQLTGSLGSAGTYSGNINNAGTLIFNQTSDQTLAGVISGAGSFIKDGSVTLTLSGANTYTGLTQVKDGTLELSGGSATFSNKLALYSGATFKLSSGATATLTQLDVHGDATYDGDLDISGGTMNFHLPSTTANGNTLLNVTGSADISDATVKVNIQGTSALQKDDEITLIATTNSGDLSGDPANNTATVRGIQGVTVGYDLGLDWSDTQKLKAKVLCAYTQEQSKPLSEAKLAGAALTRQGQDLIADAGIADALRQSKGTGGAAIFSAISLETSRYETGSHVNTYGKSLLVGLAKNKGNTTWGGFIEGGWGNHNTFNTFASGDVKGSGDSDYIGIGGLLRQDLNNGLYHEASVRIGSAGTDFSGIFGTLASGYNSRSLYYGAHYGIGKTQELKKDTAIDIYGKLLYSRQQGDSLTLETGDPVEFKALNSLRARIGAAYKKGAPGRGPVFLGGLAYEYEFMGKQKADAYGLPVSAPSLKGGTVIGELGVNLKANKDSRFSCDAKVQGYLGKREGVGLSVNLNWVF